MWYQNIGSMFFVSSQSTRVTDRQTDGENYDPQDRASIAASRGKNLSLHLQLTLILHATRHLPTRHWRSSLTTRQNVHFSSISKLESKRTTEKFDL